MMMKMDRSATHTLEAIQIKLSALWISRMLVGFLGDVLRFLEPGMMANIIGGDIEGMQLTEGMLFAAAIIMVLPILMVFFSLTMRYKLNRWSNIVLAVSLFGFDLIGLPSYSSAYATVLILIGMAFNALTVWYAWRWQKTATSVE
jgi:hypothetical protein